ncbi:Zinc finger protein 30 [Plakobranchus ocellatus]|uniref:Zinc finger protein 30 n=1 Tax=Plakobranchus ocellatus TaxID=259542 RepID=A0AAV4B3K2_9GAST|nr:Zinc finger protein 30 [Plakobranchus ocellatus]
MKGSAFNIVSWSSPTDTTAVELTIDGGLRQKDKAHQSGRNFPRFIYGGEDGTSPNLNATHVCGQCSKVMQTAEELVAHEYICKAWKYTDTMACPKCNKEFKRKDNLRVHMRNKHNIGDPTICKHCGMSFRSYLRLHEHTKNCEMNIGSVMPRFLQNN